MEYAVIYLHGFLSSPKSVKAQQTRAYLEKHLPAVPFEVPQLPNYPDQVKQALSDLVDKHQGKALRFIGSSMGGYLSTYLVEQYGGKAVLINPAVRPFELLSDYLGPHVNPYTDENFILEERHLDDLLALNTTALSAPNSYWVLLQTGDETLDYRHAEHKYAGAKLTIEPGGDHSFQDYDTHLERIFQFLLSE